MRIRHACLVISGLFLSATLSAGEQPDPITVQLRTRVQPFKAVDQWSEVALRRELNPRETAIILCDVWDKHWCNAASERCAAIATRMEPVLQQLRGRGVTIIHAPSECMNYYKELPQRQRMERIAKVTLPKPLAITDPPLPIDDSDGGCDDAQPAQQHRAWSRQHPAITIGDEDFISDNGHEVYSLLQQKGIKTLLVAGVHTNMCVLGRSFAIRQMTRWGVPCILVRDWTDAMYNPKKAPFVSHEEGTELVIQHVEKYWCPTTTSRDLATK